MSPCVGAGFAELPQPCHVSLRQGKVSCLWGFERSIPDVGGSPRCFKHRSTRPRMSWASLLGKPGWQQGLQRGPSALPSLCDSRLPRLGCEGKARGGHCSWLASTCPESALSIRTRNVHQELKRNLRAPVLLTFLPRSAPLPSHSTTLGSAVLRGR